LVRSAQELIALNRANDGPIALEPSEDNPDLIPGKEYEVLILARGRCRCMVQVSKIIMGQKRTRNFICVTKMKSELFRHGSKIASKSKIMVFFNRLDLNSDADKLMHWPKHSSEGKKKK